MASLGSLWDKIEKKKLNEGMRARLEAAKGDEDQPLLDSGDESPSMQIVRTGMDLGGKNGNFWDDLMSLANNNSDALSELLEVPKEKVANWSSKIQDVMERVKKADDESAGQSDRAEMLNTGNEPVKDQNAGEEPASAMKPY